MVHYRVSFQDNPTSVCPNLLSVTVTNIMTKSDFMSLVYLHVPGHSPSQREAKAETKVEVMKECFLLLSLSVYSTFF